MKNWYHKFADDLWLKPDNVGAEDAAFIKKALKLRRGRSVLDAPCGAGRIAIHLAHAGCNVTGIDLKQSFIKRATTRFRREKEDGIFYALDLRDMNFSNEFDGVYSWFGSFGYFKEAENIDVLNRYAQALRKGGRLLINQPNRQVLLRNFIKSHKTETLTIHNHWSAEEQRVKSDWIVNRNGNKKHNKMSIRLYTATQLKKLFEKVGLNVESIYGSIAAEPYSRTSKRLIIIGQRL